MLGTLNNGLQKGSIGKRVGSPCFKESYNPDKIVGVIKNRKLTLLLDNLEKCQYWNLKWIMYLIILHFKVSALEARFFSKWVFTCLEMIR